MSVSSFSFTLCKTEIANLTRSSEVGMVKYLVSSSICTFGEIEGQGIFLSSFLLNFPLLRSYCHMVIVLYTLKMKVNTRFQSWTSPGFRICRLLWCLTVSTIPHAFRKLNHFVHPPAIRVAMRIDDSLSRSINKVKCAASFQPRPKDSICGQRHTDFGRARGRSIKQLREPPTGLVAWRPRLLKD